MFHKKKFWLILMILTLMGGGCAAYNTLFASEGETEEAVLETATVTVGDLSITAAGTGVLVASSEVDLAFSTSGTLEELLVEVGDEVNAGDVLAWIDDASARKALADAEMQVLEAEQTLALAQAQAELSVAQAEAELEAAREDLDALVNWDPDEEEIQQAQADLYSAQASYQALAAKADMRDEQLTSVRISLDQATQALADAQDAYANAMDPARDWEKDIESTRENAADALVRAQQNLEIAQANYNLDSIDTSSADLQSAWAKVLSARSALEDLEAPPDEAEVTAARVAAQQAALAFEQAKLDLRDLGDGLTMAVREAELTLEQAKLNFATAQETVDGTTLVAPFEGTVTAINYDVGEAVNGTVMVLSNLSTPVVQFWVEESDLQSVAKGNAVNVVFEALPDFTYSGEIYQVDPELVEVGSTTAVQAWATIDTRAHPVNLLGNMNAEVEAVAGEAHNALLVPIQALREVSEGQYAVFVVKPGQSTDADQSEELELRIVEVGLKDFVNAEIISGLERGEVVSLGESTTSTSSDPQQPESLPNPMMRMFGG
jgi:HlyD family secretion protein